MVLAFAYQSPAPEKQPTTMEVVEYQRVKNALPNGAPDLDAPENFYIRVTSTYYLAADTDRLPIERDGTRHVHVDRYDYKSFVITEQKGRPSRKLSEKFTEVSPSPTGKKPFYNGSGSYSGMDFDIPKEQRYVEYYVRSVVEKVETHSEGKRRTTRTSRERFWGITGGGTYSGKVELPPLDSKVSYEAGPHVRIDPPKFGYETPILPKIDEL